MSIDSKSDKSRIPIFLITSGIAALIFPILAVCFMSPKTELPFPVGIILILTPVVLGLILVGVGIYLSFKCFSDEF